MIDKFRKKGSEKLLSSECSNIITTSLYSKQANKFLPKEIFRTKNKARLLEIRIASFNVQIGNLE